MEATADTIQGLPLSPATPTQDMDDVALATWLEIRQRSGKAVALFLANTVCKVMDMGDGAPLLHAADPDKRSVKVLRQLAKRGLLHVSELSSSQQLTRAIMADAAWDPAPIPQSSITQLLNTRSVHLGRSGRGDSLPLDAIWQVWVDAGGRCMMEGCGEDLSRVPLHNKLARLGYLAHIVASNPDGPRGDRALSHALSAQPENIMLMCDAHHRLIDCFAPDDYPTERLRAMRERHARITRQAGEALRYPRTLAITLLANIGNVFTDTNAADLRQALLESGLCMLPDVAHHIRRVQRDDRGGAVFWANYLHEHECDIHHLVKAVSQQQAEATEIAVFPLHHVATLVLAGRIVGEARRTRVFQYHRERRTWVWDRTVMPLPPETFTVFGLTGNPVDEVLLSLELTASVDKRALPSTLAARVASEEIAWVRITIPNPNFACIAHPGDLEQFKAIARKTVNHIQDVVRAKRVHLIGISPASSLFTFGQLLQAGHHPPYTIYDRSDRNVPFADAFTITGHEVQPPAGTTGVPIKIR